MANPNHTHDSPPNQFVHAVKHGIEEARTDGAFVGADRHLYDAHVPLRDVHGVLPAHHEASDTRIIYVNGIWNDVDTEYRTMHAIADATGAEVIGVHNGTSPLGVADVAQCAADKLDLIDNRAVDTLAHLIEDAVRNNEPLNLFGHSHGALCISRALEHASAHLQETGMHREQMLDGLANVHVQTFGGAAMTYPEGPQYVHHINAADGVPVEWGFAHVMGFDFTRTVDHLIKVDEFLDNRGPADNHSFEDVYLPRYDRDALQPGDVEESVTGKILPHPVPDHDDPTPQHFPAPSNPWEQPDHGHRWHNHDVPNVHEQQFPGHFPNQFELPHHGFDAHRYDAPDWQQPHTDQFHSPFQHEPAHDPFSSQGSSGHGFDQWNDLP